MSAKRDREVVDAVLAGDRDAYAILVARHQRRVFRTMYWMCGNAYDAEEIAQEVFVRAYFALASHEREHRFSTWLLTIARNQAINFVKRRGRDVHYDADERAVPGHDTLPDPAPSPHAVSERADANRRLWQAVAALPDAFRDVVILRHVSELSYNEICAVTGLPVGTVKSRLARARRRLAEAVGGDAPDPG